MSFSDVGSLQREIAGNIRYGRVFLSEVLDVPVLSEGVLVLVHPVHGRELRLSAQIVMVNPAGPMRGTGIALRAFGPNEVGQVQAFANDTSPTPPEVAREPAAISGEEPEAVGPAEPLAAEVEPDAATAAEIDPLASADAVDRAARDPMDEAAELAADGEDELAADETDDPAADEPTELATDGEDELAADETDDPAADEPTELATDGEDELAPSEDETAGDDEPEHSANTEELAFDEAPEFDPSAPARPLQTSDRQARLRSLNAVDQLKFARRGELADRIVIERLYGKQVWEALLQNPRITLPEIARIARKGSVPRPLLEMIWENTAWAKAANVRRALLSNPKLTAEAIVKLLQLTPKHELKVLEKGTAYPMAVRDAARKLLKE